MSEHDQGSEWLKIASEAAKASSAILQSKSRMDPISQVGEDIKLQEDKLSERAIIQYLESQTSLPILSEEAGWIGTPPAADGHYWVIDPLDGSFNFNRGVPLCCTSVALARGRTPVAGAIFDFNRDELFSGGPGLGLHLNGAAIPPTVARGQIIATGYPVGRSTDEHATSQHESNLRGWPKKRMIGSAALSLAWVAAGRFDAYFEPGIRWWDVAGGLALVAAAGGIVEVAGDDLNSPLDVKVEFE